MASLRVVGGHTHRTEPQVDAGASVNMYPELGERESELAARPRRFQASTHGYDVFARDAVYNADTHGPLPSSEQQKFLPRADSTPLPPVTGMAGSREPVERLVVANGRHLRIFTDPANKGAESLVTFTGSKNQRLWPTFGCCNVGDEWFWVRDDGEIWYTLPGTVEPRALITDDDFGGVTPLGLACLPNSGGTQARRLFFSCIEDRIIRAYEVRGHGDYGRIHRHDLDLGDTIAHNPESLWMDLDGSYLVIMDSCSGRILEYAYDADSTTSRDSDDSPWSLSTPPGIANPLNAQRTVGNVVTKEPITSGGVWADANEIQVARRAARQQANRFSRRTGERLDVPRPGTNRRLFPSSNPFRPATRPASWSPAEYSNTTFVPCAAVGGRNDMTTNPTTGQSNQIPTPAWYVSGSQYPDGLGRVFRWDQNARMTELSVPDMPDVMQSDPRPTPLVPLGDDGVRMAWLVDRRVNIIELENTRVVENVEGSVDSLAYSAGRLIGCDASRGVLKLSPTDQIAASTTTRYGSPVAASSISIPGRPVDSPAEVTSFFAGVRGILARATDNVLRRYNRSEIFRNPEEISGSATVLGVCLQGVNVIVIEQGANDRTLTVKTFSAPPESSSEYATPSTSNSITLSGYNTGHITAFAADTARLYVVHRTSDVTRRRLDAYTIATGARIAALEVNHPTTQGDEVDALFAGLDFEPTVPDDWLRGITFFNGVLMLAVSHLERLEDVQSGQTRSNDTTVRALRPNVDTAGMESWERAPTLDVEDDISTDNAMLSHDGQYLFEAARELVPFTTPDGLPIKRTIIAAFAAVLAGRSVDRRSRYQWDTALRTRTGAHAVAVIRRFLYSWTRTGMEIRNTADETEGFPYALHETHTIGLASPGSIAIVNDVLYWTGATSGGGLRVWQVGIDGDTVPTAVVGHSVQEMLDRIAVEGRGVDEILGYADDYGGHPNYVMHARRGGISMAYDQDAELWHMRSSLRADGDAPLTWLWLPEADGAQRVTTSTTWRNRPVFGGYDRQLRGLLAFASPTDYRDVDGGRVYRRRQITAGEAEKRLIRFPTLKVDTVYGLAGGAGLPKFSLSLSDDGGRNFDVVEEREIIANEPTPAFTGLGLSYNRVYRIDCEAPVSFTLIGVYQEEGGSQVQRSPS